MRQPPDHQRGIEADRGEHVGNELVALFRVLHAGDDQRFGDDVADPPPGIERGDRILKDQLHALAHLA